MKRMIWCGALVVLAVLYLTPLRAMAQTEEEKAQLARDAQIAEQKRVSAMKEALAQPTPRMSDGHPDISGVWGNGQAFGTYKKNDTGIHVLAGQREAPKSLDPDGKIVRYNDQADGDRRRALNPNKPPYKQELMAKVHQLDKLENRLDPVVSCHPTGVPRAFPAQIIAAPGYLVFLYTGENSGHYRLIPFTAKHPDSAFSTYWGDSIARWEGDTLVIDVTNFNDNTWLGGDGWIHSPNMHVVERFQREGNVLHYQATVEDPDTMTRPWVIAPRTVLLNHEELNYVFEDLPCKDFDNAHIVNYDHF